MKSRVHGSTEQRPESDRVSRARLALEALAECDPARRAALVEGLYAEDFVMEVPARGGCEAHWSLLRGEFLDGSIEVVEAFESGTRVITHARFEAEREHEVDGVRRMQHCTADGIVTFEFRGDEIVKSWSMLRWR